MPEVGAAKEKHSYFYFIVCRSFEPPSSIENPLYDQVPFSSFSQTSHSWQYLFGNIIQIKYRINKKNSQEKVFSGTYKNRKISIASLDAQYLKVKDIELGISLIKHFCITINMHKLNL